MHEKRVEFTDALTRNRFFEMTKQHTGTRSWKELRTIFGLQKSRLEYYRNGTFLIPDEKFEQMLAFFLPEEQQFFRSQASYKDKNWGQVKGGNITAERHPENYDRARDIALAKRKELQELRDRLIDPNMPLSKELCEFIGAIIGDGCIDGYLRPNGTSKHHRSFIGHSELDLDYLSNRIATIAKTLFHTNSRLYKRKDKNAIVLNFNSKPLFNLLTCRFEFPAGSKTYTVQIPNEILAAEEKLILACIRGIFDTDGCIFF